MCEKNTCNHNYGMLRRSDEIVIENGRERVGNVRWDKMCLSCGITETLYASEDPHEREKKIFKIGDTAWTWIENNIVDGIVIDIEEDKGIIYYLFQTLPKDGERIETDWLTSKTICYTREDANIERTIRSRFDL